LANCATMVRCDSPWGAPTAAGFVWPLLHDLRLHIFNPTVEACSPAKWNEVYVCITLRPRKVTSTSASSGGSTNQRFGRTNRSQELSYLACRPLVAASMIESRGSANPVQFGCSLYYLPFIHTKTRSSSRNALSRLPTTPPDRHDQLRPSADFAIAWHLIPRAVLADRINAIS
jgi:hypothetical protein